MPHCPEKAKLRSKRYYKAHKELCDQRNRDCKRKKLSTPEGRAKHAAYQQQWRKGRQDAYNAVQRRSAQNKRDGIKKRRKAKPISWRTLEKIRRQAVIDAPRKAMAKISAESRYHFGFFSQMFGESDYLTRKLESYNTEELKLTSAVSMLVVLLQRLGEMPDNPDVRHKPRKRKPVPSETQLDLFGQVQKEADRPSTPIGQNI